MPLETVVPSEHCLPSRELPNEYVRELSTQSEMGHNSNNQSGRLTTNLSNSS